MANQQAGHRDIGQRLREVRIHLGLGQRELAERLGISASHYAKCESGNNSLSDRSYEDFCRITGVTRLWLEMGDGPLPKLRLRDEDPVPYGVRPDDTPPPAPGGDLVAEAVRATLQLYGTEEGRQAVDAFARLTGEPVDDVLIRQVRGKLQGR